MPDDPRKMVGDDLSPRQLRRREVKEAGRRSSAVAHTLMLLPDQALLRLGLDPDLREGFLKARTIRNTGARRREERRLAGVLRLGDLDEIEQMLRRQEEGGQADARLFKKVEAWRARLIAGGREALEAFHEANPDQRGPTLHQLVRQAMQEEAHGKPRGAKKALFRHIAGVLKEQE